MWIVPLAIVALLVAVAAVVTFVPLSNPETGAGLEIEGTKIESRSDFTMTTTVANAGINSLYPLERIAVVSQSDHLLMRRAIPQVVKGLAQLPVLGKVDYFGCGEWPAKGHLPYDMYILVDMPAFDETGFVLSGRTIDATITVNAGSDLWSSGHHEFSRSRPPRASMYLSGALNHHSVTKGYESAGARYKSLAQNVAGELTDHLTTHIAKQAAEYGVANVPESLYPPFRPLPEGLPVINIENAQQVIHGRGLMVHNMTVWRAQSDSLDALEDLQQRLAAAAWKIETCKNSSREGLFKADLNEDSIEGFITRDDHPDALPHIVVKYVDYMNKEDLGSTIDKLLDDDSVALDVLACVEHNMSNKQRDRLARRVGLSTSTNPNMQLLVARYLRKNNDDDAALERLNLAFVLAQACGLSTWDSQITELGKKITGQDDWKATVPSESMMSQCGIIFLTPDGEGVKAQLALNERLVVYLPPVMDAAAKDDSNRPHVAMLRIHHAAQPEAVYGMTLRLKTLGSSPGGSVESVRSPLNPPSPFHGNVGAGYNQCNVYADVQEVDEKQFMVTLRRRDDSTGRLDYKSSTVPRNEDGAAVRAGDSE